MLNSFISSKIWPIVVLTIFVIIFWHPVLYNNEFFYDDTSFLDAFDAGEFSLKYMFIPHNDHLMPHFKLAFYLIYKLFGKNITPCMVLSIFVHIVNAILFFSLCRLMFSGKRWLPLFAAIFFAVNSSHFEVLHWFTVINTALSFMFLLITLLLLHKYTLENKAWMFFLSLVSSFFIPMGFSLGLAGIVFIYLYAWLILRVRNVKIYGSYLLVWLLFMVLYAVFVVFAGYSRTEVLSFNVLDIAQYVGAGFFGAFFRTMGFSIVAPPHVIVLSALLALQLVFIGYFLILYFLLNKKEDRERIFGDRSIMWFCILGTVICYAAVGIGRSHLSKDVFLQWGRYQYFPIFFLSIFISNIVFSIFRIFARIFSRRRLFVFFAVLFVLYLCVQFAVIREKAFSSFRTEGALPRIEISA